MEDINGSCPFHSPDPSQGWLPLLKGRITAPSSTIHAVQAGRERLVHSYWSPGTARGHVSVPPPPGCWAWICRTIDLPTGPRSPLVHFSLPIIALCNDTVALVMSLCLVPSAKPSWNPHPCHQSPKPLCVYCMTVASILAFLIRSLWKAILCLTFQVQLATSGLGAGETPGGGRVVVPHLSWYGSFQASWKFLLQSSRLASLFLLGWEMQIN